MDLGTEATARSSQRAYAAGVCLAGSGPAVKACSAIAIRYGLAVEQAREGGRESVCFTPGRVMGQRRWDASGRREQLNAILDLFLEPLPRTAKAASSSSSQCPEPWMRRAPLRTRASGQLVVMWRRPPMPRHLSRLFQQPCGGPIEIRKQLRERYCTAGRAFEAVGQTAGWTLGKPGIQLNAPVLTGISMCCAVDHRTN